MSDLRVVRVLPDVSAIDKTFDYLVPDELRDQVGVGDMVRIVLHGRRVGGWIVELDVAPPPGVAPSAGVALGQAEREHAIVSGFFPGQGSLMLHS